MVDTMLNLTAEHLASKISEAVIKSPKTQDAIAEEVGVSKAALSKWKRTGQITVTNLYRLAVVVEKPLPWFFPEWVDTETEQDASGLLSTLQKIQAAGDTQALEDLLFEVLAARRSLADR